MDDENDCWLQPAILKATRRTVIHYKTAFILSVSYLLIYFSFLIKYLYLTFLCKALTWDFQHSETQLSLVLFNSLYNCRITIFHIVFLSCHHCYSKRKRLTSSFVLHCLLKKRVLYICWVTDWQLESISICSFDSDSVWCFVHHQLYNNPISLSFSDKIATDYTETACA